MRRISKAISRPGCLWASLLILAPLCWGQEPGPPESAPIRKEARHPPAGLLLRPAGQLEAPLWIELTPLAAPNRRKVLEIQPGQETKLEPTAFREGKAMLCWGADDQATTCEQVRGEPGRSIELALGKGVALTGRFVEGDTPVGASVSLAPSDLREAVLFTIPLERSGDRLLREVRSGPDGTFRIPRLAAGEYYLEAHLATGGIYRSEAITVPSREELTRGRQAADESSLKLDLGDIFVSPGVEVEFLVTDLWGEPLAEATVGVSQGSDPSKIRSFKATTGPGGGAVVAGVDPLVEGETVCQAAGHLEVREKFEQPPGFFQCALEPLAKLTGLVVDEVGDALPQATVSLDLPERMGSRSSRQPDEEGRFSFQELPAGEYELVLAAPGFAAEHRKVTLDPGAERRLEDVTLHPGKELSGLVIDEESGEHVAGAEVRVLEPPGGGDAVTDEEGRFALTVGDETLTLAASAPSYATRTLELKPPRFRSEETLTIELSAGGQILVEVFDELTGQPCEDCRVNAGGNMELRTDAGGRALSKSLQPGRYAVSLTQTRSRGSLLTRQGGENVKIAEVHAHRTTTLRFGEPRVSLEISLDPPLPAGWQLAARGPSLVDTYKPNPDGTFTVRRPQGEPVELFLSSSVGGGDRSVWLGRVPADYDGRRLELGLSRSTLSGQFLEGDEALAGRIVQLLSLDQSTALAWSRTDADGTFALPFVAPGTYVLSLEGRMAQVVTVAAEQQDHLGAIQVRAEDP